MVKDRVTPEDVKLIEIPLKSSHLTVNLSDTSFETMGDTVADVIDEAHEKVHSGKEAAEMLKILAHNNATQEKYG